MVFRYNKIGTISPGSWILLSFFAMMGCSENSKPAADTFYIELVNFNDSLRNNISINAFGKVAFYKNKQLQVLSQNFLTEEYPGMHYLEGIPYDDSNIKPGENKIRVEFVGNYSVDSIRYSLQKYKFRNNQWNKISDLGVLKAVTTFKKAKQFSVNEFGKQIVSTVAEYTFQ